MMRKFLKLCFPAPLISLSLMALWLVLERSVSLGQIIISILLGILIPIWVARLRPTPTRVRHPLIIVRFIAMTGRDVLASNLEVFFSLLAAWLHLRPYPKSRFVTIPLDLHTPAALASLAAVCTVVPGTVWCEMSPRDDCLRLHVWDIPDDEAEKLFITRFKKRYEVPLKLIFEDGQTHV